MGSILDWLQRQITPIPEPPPERIERTRFVGRFTNLPAIGSVGRRIVSPWPERTLISLHNDGTGDIRLSDRPDIIRSIDGWLLAAGIAQDIESMTGDLYAVGDFGHAVSVWERVRVFES